jgi:hypothetical protein
MKKLRHNPKKGFSLVLFLFIPLGVFFFSCNQDPIFYNISQEVTPKEPEIPGSPTKIVESGNGLYVSNGKALYTYTGSQWHSTGTPPGRITDVASDGSALYCIVENKTLYRTNGGSWEPIPIPEDYTYLQNIYGTAGSLYVCASNGNEYTIYSGGALRPIGRGENYLLRGAAGNYIATTGGIYNSSNMKTPISGSTGYTIMGLILLPDGTTVAASTKDGVILHGNGSSFTPASVGLTFDRAMATYKTTSDRYLLLVGVYTKGYVEITLGPNGSWLESASHQPGEGTYNQTTTVHDNAQYRSSLGIQSLISLYQVQVQGKDGVLFASTQQKGLWAYQYRSEGWQWNAY